MAVVEDDLILKIVNLKVNLKKKVENLILLLY